MFLVYFKYYFRSRATPRRVKTWVCPWRPPWSGTPVLRMAALPPSLFVLIGRAGCNQWDQSGPFVTSQSSREQLGLIGTNWDQFGPFLWAGRAWCWALPKKLEWICWRMRTRCRSSKSNSKKGNIILIREIFGNIHENKSFCFCEHFHFLVDFPWFCAAGPELPCDISGCDFPLHFPQ